MTAYYKIAGLNVEFIYSVGENPLNKIPGFSVFEKKSVEGPVNITFDATCGGFDGFGVNDNEYLADVEAFKTSPEQYRKIYEFDFEDENIACALYLQENKNFFVMSPENSPSFYYIATPIEGERLVVKSNWEMVRNNSVLRFGLWMAFASCALMNKAIAIHSSTIVCFDPAHRNGKAALFLGESGTGKSTHTRLYLSGIKGSRLLNDDCPIIKVEEDGTINAYGSPWSGKTHCYHDRAFPVAGLCRLNQAPDNKIRQLGVLEAITALYPSCPPALVRQKFFNDKVCDILSAIISSVGIWHLDCLPNEDAAELSYSKIFSW